jgi:lipid II:glycine glycyltransferase (peptidoglycan interpeptide bridge formation enzyme)
VRRAEKLGVDVFRSNTRDSVSTFFEQCAQSATEKGYGLAGAEDLESVFNSFAASGSPGTLFFSTYEGNVVSGLGLMPAGDRVIYEWGFSRTVAGARNLPLAHRMHWEAMQWAKTEGYRYYDMGGFWESKGKSDSINRFKQGFSPEIQPVLGEYYFPLSPITGRAMEAAIVIGQRIRARSGS